MGGVYLIIIRVVQSTIAGGDWRVTSRMHTYPRCRWSAEVCRGVYRRETGFTHVGGETPSLSERSHPCSTRCPTTRRGATTKGNGARRVKSDRGRRAKRGERRERCAVRACARAQSGTAETGRDRQTQEQDTLSSRADETRGAALACRAETGQRTRADFHTDTPESRHTAKNMTHDLGQDLAPSPSLGLGATHDPSLG